MGYETRLYIGKESSLTKDEIKKGAPELDGDSVYHPYLKDEHGDLVKTGRVETWFQVMAMIDLCKTGYETETSKIDWKNTDKTRVWYFYEGDISIKEDKYGEMFKPVPIETVLTALKKDNETEEYRRFTWAIALLESMKDDPQGLTVLFYGH